MIQRLRIKFVCINMAIVLLMLSATLGTVLWFTQTSAEQESIRRMQAAAHGPHPVPGPDAPFTGLRTPYFTLWREPDGSLLVEGDAFSDLSGEEVLWELYEAASEADTPPVGILSAHRLRYCRVDTPLGPRIVFADISGEQATQRGLLRTCLLIGAASAGVFLLLSILLARWAVRPVDEAWQQQRQFVSDASHELKTPLTVILTNAELLQNTADDAARTRFTDNIVVMSRQMRELLEALLELARADDGIYRQNVGTVDLSRLTETALLPFEPIYFEKGLTLSSTVEHGIQVRGSEQHLRQVLSILLDNAQKYAASPGAVTVILHASGPRHCRLSVSNTGPALTPQELRLIFKRFYRADEARSRDGSYGLGLSIAESIVRQHGGRIWAESAGGMNTFTLQLPRRGSAP